MWNAISRRRRQLSASEALYGFCGWLTTRETATVMSARDEAGPIVRLIATYIRENELDEPRGNWHIYAQVPSDEATGVRTHTTDHTTTHGECVEVSPCPLDFIRRSSEYGGL